MKKWSWLLAMLLGVGMMVCVGCEDDDDDEGGGTTTTIVTNIVNGTTVVVTNTVAADDVEEEEAEVEEEGDGPTLIAILPPPVIIEPADGQTYSSFVELKVIFAWGDVTGAKHYVYEVDGVQHTTQGTSAAVNLNIGNHSWKVWAVAPSGQAGFSSSASFAINVPIFIPGL